MNPSAILVPQGAVTRDPKGGATAFVLNAQNHAELRTLTVPRAVGDRWLVTSGLKPGDRLIVDGLQKVQPGAPVRPVALKEPVPGAPAARPGV
jgi:membrane fusion protein (multidrug efflux system)